MRHYRIGELAARCEVSPRTIDYYTRVGLLLPKERSAGRHRLYDESAIRRLRQIKALQASRLTLAEVRERLADVAVPGHDALARIETIGEELARLRLEAFELQVELVGTDSTAEGHLAAVRAASAAATRALALGSFLAGLVTDGQVPLA